MTEESNQTTAAAQRSGRLRIEFDSTQLDTLQKTIKYIASGIKFNSNFRNVYHTGSGGGFLGPPRQVCPDNDVNNYISKQLRMSRHNTTAYKVPLTADQIDTLFPGTLVVPMVVTLPIGDSKQEEEQPRMTVVDQAEWWKALNQACPQFCGMVHSSITKPLVDSKAAGGKIVSKFTAEYCLSYGIDNAQILAHLSQEIIKCITDDVTKHHPKTKFAMPNVDVSLESRMLTINVDCYGFDDKQEHAERGHLYVTAYGAGDKKTTDKT